MAISPKDLYPANIVTADAAYPHGKARNKNNPGDGTGTPLEAAWLNDLFGFWQALLNAVGVTPSGNPDKVGASQYLDAIKFLINALRNTSGSWLGEQDFALSNVHVSNVFLASDREGILYEGFNDGVYPQRKWMIPLKPLRELGWTFSSTLQWVTATANDFTLLLGHDGLPGGALVTDVLISVSTAVAVEAHVSQASYPTSDSDPSPATFGTVYSDTFTPSGTQDHVLHVSIPSGDIGAYSADRMVRIIVSPAGGGSCAIRWAAVRFADQLISNT